MTYAKHRWPNLEKAEDKLFLQRKSLIISAMCSVEINLRKDLNIQIEDGKCMLNRREQKDKVGGVMAVVQDKINERNMKLGQGKAMVIFMRCADTVYAYSLLFHVSYIIAVLLYYYYYH